MDSICIEAPGFNLDLSMFPSFISSLFAWIDNCKWVRVIGECAFQQYVYSNNGFLCCKGCGCSKRLLHGISGEWCRNNCEADLGRALSKFKSKITPLLSKYSGLMVSASLEPIDRLLTAYAVVLSQNTSYAVNVLKWMNILFSSSKSLNEVIGRAKKAPQYISSYQAVLLSKIAEDVASILFSNNTVEEKRTMLLKLKNIGPKTAHAILLYAGFSTEYPPPDTHLEKLVSQLLGFQDIMIPNKNWCFLSTSCRKCPRKSRCISGLTVHLFGKAAGLIQVLAYTHYTLRNREKLYNRLYKYYSLKSRISYMRTDTK